MEILDLTEKYHSQYFCCLEDWSDEMQEAGDPKEIWFNKPLKGRLYEECHFSSIHLKYNIHVTG